MRIRKFLKFILFYVDIVAQVCNLPRDESAVADLRSRNRRSVS